MPNTETGLVKIARVLGEKALLLALCLLLAAPAVQASGDETRWDGADDLAVDPLPCGMDAIAANAQPTAEALAYDGGIASDAPDKRGQPISLVDVPKLMGIAYYDAVSLGQREAAAELGNVAIATDAPSEADIDEQIAIIDSAIAHGVDGILFAANDPVLIAPVLRKALGAGVRVVGYDANSEPDAREFFVTPAAANGIAKALVESLVDQSGESAAFGIVTSFYAAPNQSRWIAELWAYAGACYPDLVWLETLEGREKFELALQQAQSLLEKHGGELDAILALSSVVTPGSAEAIKQADLCGAVAIVGLATPNDVKEFVNGGCMRDMIAWNPIDLGYAVVYVIRALIDGDFQPGDASVLAGRLGQLAVVNGSEVLLGAPFIFTVENINDFDF